MADSFNVRPNSGFTLIEVMMVIVVISVMAIVAVPQFIDFRKDAKIAVTNSRLNEIRMAILGDPRQVAAGQYINPGFIRQVGSLPTSLDDLVTQGAYPTYDPFKKTGWRGPYLSTVQSDWNKDAWGTALQYSSGSRTITSCGPNRACGDSDDIAVSF